MTRPDDSPVSTECPVCGYPLTYVEKTIVRSEYPVTSLREEFDPDDGKRFLLPEYASAENESFTMEVISRSLTCSRVECTYVVSDVDLGEAVPSD